MTNAESTAHGWTWVRLELHHAGLLEPDEDERVREHVAGCGPCRQVLDAIESGTPVTAEGEHVPSSVLARWPAIADSLPALERELVAAHVESCDACREDQQIARRALAAGTAAREPLRAAFPWSRVWATAATAAAAGFALLWWTGRPVQPRTTVVPDAPAPIAMRVSPEPVRLRDAMRGDGTVAPVLVEPGAREPVALAFDPLDVPDEAPVALEIARNGGSTVVRTACLQRELYPTRHLLVGDASSPLPDGSYVLRVIAWPGSARADSQVFAFTVRRRR